MWTLHCVIFVHISVANKVLSLSLCTLWTRNDVTCVTWTFIFNIYSKVSINIIFCRPIKDLNWFANDTAEIYFSSLRVLDTRLWWMYNCYIVIFILIHTCCTLVTLRPTLLLLRSVWQMVLMLLLGLCVSDITWLKFRYSARKPCVLRLT